MNMTPEELASAIDMVAEQYKAIQSSIVTVDAFEAAFKQGVYFGIKKGAELVRTAIANDKLPFKL